MQTQIERIPGRNEEIPINLAVSLCSIAVIEVFSASTHAVTNSTDCPVCVVSAGLMCVAASCQTGGVTQSLTPVNLPSLHSVQDIANLVQ